MQSIETEIARYYNRPKAFWTQIPKYVQDEFREHAITITVKRNGAIYNEGNYPKGLYILKKGIARMYVMNQLGEEQTIYMMTVNEMFGYRSVLCRDESPVFITAIEDCEIEMISRDVFMTQLNKSIELNTLFLEYFGSEFRVLCNKISFFALKPVEERVALSLLILNQKFRHDSSDRIVRFSRKEIANYAGTIAETLSRQLKALLDIGAISIKGRTIMLTDTRLLYNRANI